MNKSGSGCPDPEGCQNKASFVYKGTQLDALQVLVTAVGLLAAGVLSSPHISCSCAYAYRIGGLAVDGPHW